MKMTAQLPRSWFRYAPTVGPPIGSSIEVSGRRGSVTGVREIAGDMLEIDVEAEDDPIPDGQTALLGIPGTLDLDDDVAPGSDRA